MPTSRPKSRFNQSVIPTIACFNKAGTPLGVDFEDLVAAMQIFVDDHVVPAWGTPAKLVKSSGFVAGSWAMVFIDDADQPGALAYHDLTPDGLPLSKVFVRTAIRNNDLVSVAASHELVETLVDPAINMMTAGPQRGVMYAYESADPVEALSFPVNGVPMTDFVYPAYFEDFHQPGSVQFDLLKQVKKPFQILSDGYQTILRNGKWSESFGSDAKRKRFAQEDRRGHRSERRQGANLTRAYLKKLRSAGLGR